MQTTSQQPYEKHTWMLVMTGPLSSIRPFIQDFGGEPSWVDMVL